MGNCDPYSIIKAPRGREDQRFANGETDDIISVILEADAISDRTINTAGIDCLRGATGYDTLNNVWRFVKYNNRYNADKSHQKIKTPSALFHSGTGDCKSYAVATAALLRALGFTGIRYRFASYAPGPYTHVYVVCRLNGRTVVLDSVHSRFDDEVPYTAKKDYAATGISGINGLPASQQGYRVNGTIQNFLTLAALAASGWLLSEILRK